MVRLAVSRVSKPPIAALAGPSGIWMMARIWLVRVFSARLAASLGFSCVVMKWISLEGEIKTQRKGWVRGWD